MAVARFMHTCSIQVPAQSKMGTRLKLSAYMLHLKGQDAATDSRALPSYIPCCLKRVLFLLDPLKMRWKNT